MLSRRAFALCTLAAVLLVSGESARADMLVSSRTNSEILRYDETTGAFLGVFASGVGMIEPWDMTLGSDGNLYVADIGTGTGVAGVLRRFDGQAGTYIDSLDRDESSLGGGPITGVRFGPDGNLYIIAGNRTIERYDAISGPYIDNFSIGDFGSGLAFGPDGNLYVSELFLNVVMKFNGMTGAPMGVFASGGGLLQPWGLTFGPDGNLYVSSHLSASVLRYNGVTGEFMDTFASGGGLLGPNGLAFGPGGNLYVAAGGIDQQIIGKVFRYNGLTGAFIDEFASGGGLHNATALVFTSNFTPTQAVPEPSTLALSSILLGMLGLRRMRKRLIGAQRPVSAK